VVKVSPAYTSQRCNTCGEVDRRSRESQARFRCTSCGHTAHADVNAARNIRDGARNGAARGNGGTAAGRAVAARGGGPLGQPVNREPQLTLTS
jgi:putative transposase